MLRTMLAVVLAGLLALGAALPALADEGGTSNGQQGNEGQSGNQGNNGQQGHEGQPGNQGG